MLTISRCSISFHSLPELYGLINNCLYNVFPLRRPFFRACTNRTEECSDLRATPHGRSLSFHRIPSSFCSLLQEFVTRLKKRPLRKKCDNVRQVEYMSPFTPNRRFYSIMGNNLKSPTVMTRLNAKFWVYRSRLSSWWKTFAKLLNFVLFKQHKWLNLTIIKTTLN